MKLERRKERVVARTVAENWLPELAEGFQAALARNHSQVYREFLAVVRGLSPDVLAACVIHGALHSIGRKKTYLETILDIGSALAGECWAAGLTRNEPKLAKRIENIVRKKGASSKRNRETAYAIAAREGYKTNEWSEELRAQAGNWAVDQLLALLPNVFTIKKFVSKNKKGQEKGLVIAEEALAYADSSFADLIQRSPVWLPKPEAPPLWTDWDRGGTSDKRLSLVLRVVRGHHKITTAAVRKAIRDGTMRPALNALNALQSVPWKINLRVLDVMRECATKGVEVSGVPIKDVPLPEIERPWKDLPPDQRKALAREADQVRKINRSLVGDRTLFDEDVRTAQAMAAHERFWTPMNLDWRGRVYGVPSFNFQREDHVRALFLFADGEPVGEEGLYWLKVHCANCGDFNKISKRPFGERVKWVENNLHKIESVAATPMNEPWWTEADAPFQFLAACFELSAALATGPTFVSRLPISFDGSCSGLQHLSAMTRDKETAALVNLTPNVTPQDIYQKVADIVAQRVEQDAVKGDETAATVNNAIRTLDRRKLVKRNVMTYSYSSPVIGMAEQLRDDTMAALSLKVLKKEIPEHPFGADDGYKASLYLAKITYRAIKDTVPLPAQAMAFLKNLVRVAAKDNMPPRWTTPVGLPWINLYYKPEYKRLGLWLQGASYKVKVAVGNKDQIDTNKATNGVAPNFVHACDAAHLMLTVNAAAAEGITSMTTVHDSFGCLAARAERFRKIIREQFVQMYEDHNVLAEVLEETRESLSEPDAKRPLPALPSEGTLDLKQALNAEFAFA